MIFPLGDLLQILRSNNLLALTPSSQKGSTKRSPQVVTVDMGALRAGCCQHLEAVLAAQGPGGIGLSGESVLKGVAEGASSIRYSFKYNRLTQVFSRFVSIIISY